VFADKRKFQLISNDSDQHNAAVDGVDYVATLIKEYAVFESLYFQRPVATLQREATENVEKLYYHVLEYQARAACHFASRTGYRMLRNTFKIDNWDGLLTTVKSLDQTCKDMFRVFDTVDYRDYMGSIECLVGDQSPKIDEILAGIRKLLSSPESPTNLPDPCFTVPFLRDGDFVGRGEHLKRLETLFFQYRRNALVGLGGVG
jgi:hypothetical protein